ILREIAEGLNRQEHAGFSVYRQGIDALRHDHLTADESAAEVIVQHPDAVRLGEGSDVHRRSPLVRMSEAEMPPSLSGMSWMVKNSIGGVGELCGAVAPACIGPLIPPAKRGGRKREVDPRDVVDGIMYVLSTGCQWRYIPKDLPPRSTVYRYFCLWGYDGTLDRIHYALYEKCREQAGREASPTAAIIDSQSVKSAEKGGPCIDPPGFDAGKLIKGKKRH